MRCPTCKREFPAGTHQCKNDGSELLAPLDDLVKRGPVAIAQATKIAVAIARELVSFHRTGRAHGKVALANVYYRHVGDALTVLVEADDIPSERLRPFSAPEVLRGGPPSSASDLFGLGAILHDMVSGSISAESKTRSSLASFSLQDVPDELDALIMAMLAPSPSARPNTAREVLEALEDIALGATSTGEHVESFLRAARSTLSDLDAPTTSLDAPTTTTQDPIPVGFRTDAISQNPTRMDLTSHRELEADHEDDEDPSTVIPEGFKPPISSSSGAPRITREIMSGDQSIRVSVPPLRVQLGPDKSVDPYGDTVLRTRAKLEEEIGDAIDDVTKLPPSPPPPPTAARPPSPSPPPSVAAHAPPTAAGFPVLLKVLLSAMVLAALVLVTMLFLRGR